MDKVVSQKIKSGIGFYFSIFVLLLAFGGVGLLYYWKFFPSKVLVINKLPIPVSKPENIASGRVLILHFDFCKYSDTRGKVEPSLVSDRNVVILPSYEDTLPAKCLKVDGPLILPYTLITQTYHVHYKVTYQVNPIRTDVIEFDTVNFELLPAMPISK